MMQDDRNKIIKELYEFIDLNCIFRCNPFINYVEGLPDGVIAASSPKKDNNGYQFMLRRLTHNPKMLSYVSYLMFDNIIKTINNNTEYPAVQLCGLETSSIPLMIGIQQYAARFGISINSFSIRKQRKSYGIFHLIDGIPTDAPVIVVDDLINSGKSIGKCLDVCFYELNLTPAKNMYSIITFDQKLSTKKTYKDIQFTINSIFSKTQFDFAYDESKYWLPYDCDKSKNKRPEYI